MKIRLTELGVATYLAPTGPLVEANLSDLQASVQEASKGGAPKLVINLGQVPFLDSRALEFLLDLSSNLRRNGGTLCLANVGTVCRDVLAMTGLDGTIPVYDDIESAGESFL